MHLIKGMASSEPSPPAHSPLLPAPLRPQVATYDQLKGMYAKMGLGSGLLNQFCSSMSAGLIYSLITMPLETAKNRMAFQTADAAGKLPYTSTVQTVQRVAATDGVFALWNGFLPYCALLPLNLNLNLIA